MKSSGWGLATPEVARELGCTPYLVGRELDRHRIPRRGRWSDHTVETPIDGLEVGRSVEVETESGEIPTTLYKKAKSLGIRIIIRRIGPHRFRIERTPSLTPEAVKEMRASGMNVNEIADVYRAAEKTIRSKLAE